MHQWVWMKRLIGAGVLVCILASMLHAQVPLAYAAGTITGTVFQDYNDNGTLDNGTAPNYAIDNGVAGITVTAYDSSNVARGTATTGTSGTYTLAAAGSGPYRIEFTNLPAGYQPSAHGTSTNTAVQFVADGTSSGINLGIMRPEEYCQNNPNLATPCYQFGPATGNTNPGVYTYAYNSAEGSGTTTSLATTAQVGATWGMAYQRGSGNLFAAAFMRRHAGFGPGGTGAIYRIAPNGGGVSTFINLNTLFGVNTAGADPHTTTGDWLHDPAAFDQVGKVGLGGLTIDDADTTLYTVNLANKSLYRIPIGTAPTAPAASAITSYSVPMPATSVCANADMHPFGAVFHQGLVYVTTTCTAQSTQNTAQLQGFVYTFDPATSAWSTNPVFTLPLNYNRRCANDRTTAGCETNLYASADWLAWTATFPPNAHVGGGANGGVTTYPQPWLTDLSFDKGNLVLGIRDRLGDQLGSNTGNTTAGTNTLYAAISAGDLLRACGSAAAGWTVENNAACGGITTSGANTAQGIGNGEYYYQDDFPAYHDEVSMGAVAQLPGAIDVMMNAYDPNRSSGIYAGGTRWMTNATGVADRSFTIYAGNTAGTGGKSNGLGDVTILCDKAPIEVGNRVWRDDNNNGIQDPGEPAIAGVQVQLLNGSGTVVSTATTDANGNYYFSSATGTTTASAIYGLTLAQNTAYTVRVVTTQAALAGMTPATANADASANGDSRDSDGVVNGANDDIAITTGGAGANNHTYDFGFVVTAVSIGNQVWYDTNNNGVIDANEQGVNGVTVNLFLDANNNGTIDAAEQTPVATQTTSSGGYYLFTQTTGGAQLNAGQYVVGIAPSNFTGTGVLAGSRSSGTSIANTGVVNEAAIAANGTTDSNADNADDGTTQTAGFYSGGVLSGPIVISLGGEPTNEPTFGQAVGSTPGHINTVDGTAGGMAIPDANSNLTVDFGFYRQTLGNLVWNDTNNNSVYNAGVDTALPGATVKLYTADGTTEIPVGPDGILGTADDAAGGVVTGATGTYLFQNLPQGQYIVTVTPPAGYTSSPDIATSGTPDNGIDNDDNGLGGAQGTASSAAITLTPGSLGAANANTVALNTGTTANPTLDFGFYTLSLGNLVWNDVNNNGVKDAAEAGIDGVAVNLFRDTNGNGVLDAADAAAGSTTTSNGGHYLFTGLAPATYFVQLAPGNFQAGGALVGYQSSSGTNGSLTGPYEPGTNTATDNDDNGTTGTGGAATNGVTGGIRSGPIALTAGTQPTNETDLGTPTGVTDPASNANSNLTIDFGVYQPASLGDFVWRDTNTNGVQDATELGINGVQVSLYTANGKDGIAGNADDNQPVATTVTATNGTTLGYYHFANLNPTTTYTVALDRASDFAANGPLAGLTLTLQDQGGDDTKDSDAALANGVPTIASATTGGPGTDTPTYDIGFTTRPSLGDYVWLDANNNGIQDANENGINGVQVSLYASNGTTLLQTVITANNGTNDGYYHFANLQPNTTYVIKLDRPADFTGTGPLANTQLSPANQGNNDAIDSDAALVNGVVTIATATTGGIGTDTPTYDIGFYRPTASLGNYLWNDANKNGIQDANEAGINGVTVNLYDSTGTTLLKTVVTTNNGTNDGFYQFADLIPNTTYQIKLDKPTDYAPGGPLNGFVLSPADQGTDDARDSDATSVGGYPTITAATTGADLSDTLTYDIGLYQPLSIGNLVWNDINNNGVRDGSEVGVDGVTVELYQDTDGSGTLSAGDALIDTQTTSNGGHYLFTDLGQANYLVVLPTSNFATGAPLAGYISSIGAYNSATGPYEPGVTTTADNNDNGTQQNGGIVSTLIALAPGAQPTNEPDQTLPTGVTDSAQDANSNLTIDFGVFQPARVGNVVWNDTNGDGVKQPTEPGVSGVTVTLYDAAGTPVATTTTGTDGGYQFVNLPPDTYTLGFTNLPADTTFTSQNQGGNPANDSDVDPTTGRTTPVVLSAGENNPTVFAGLTPQAPTAITLNSFTAIRTAAGITVAWTTGSEVDTLGFHLLRSTDGTLTHATRVTGSMILAHGRGTGASYTWADTAAPSGAASYWLEETDAAGATHRYGPASTSGTTAAARFQVFVPVAQR